jgi:hypothetical protein
MKPVKAFILFVAGAGVFTVLGSALGAAVAHRVLFVGGVAGGLIGCFAAAWLGARLDWIPMSARRSAAVGASLGFAAAAAIAVNTLRSPVGPVLSSLLVGAGGLVGARFARGRSASADENRV